MTKVLDHGFVELIDVMGDDLEPARAARVSYGTEARGWLEGDAKLTKFLLDNGHTSPFEMVELKFHVKAPIFVARQWVRHRTANWNEFSMRYADPARLSAQDEIEYYTPQAWRAQDPVYKQGSTDEIVNDVEFFYRQSNDSSIATYHKLVGQGVARELARMVLPVSVYTEWVWKNDLRNTLHFLKLRMDEHAQWEIRQYANAMHVLLSNRLPKLMGTVGGL